MARQFRHWYRGYLVDHHSPDPPIVTLSRLDPGEYLTAYRTAHLDHAMLYCKDHWGVTYYDTEVPGGKKHPGLTDAVAGGDLIGTMSRLLAESGIGFVAYYSVGFDTRAAMLHPEWCVRDEAGEALRVGSRPPRKWHWVCKASPYADYAVAQIGEILERYRPAALFLDIYHQPFCYCQYCQRLYFERYGSLPPLGADKAAFAKEMQDFRDDVYQFAFLQRLVSLRDRVSPDTALTINGGHSIHRRRVLELCDFLYSEPWGSNWTSAVFARGTGTSPQIGPGNLGEVYDPPHPNVYVAELASIVANGCRAFAFSGSQHTDGTLDRAEFERLGGAFGPVQQLQPYLEGAAAVPSVAILFSEASRLWGPGVEYREGVPTAPHLDGVDGAMAAAAYSLWPVDVLPEWRLDADLRRFQVLVAPDACCLSAAACEQVRAFVSAGGALLATQDTSLFDEDGRQRRDFALADVFGCRFRHRHGEYAANRYGSYLDRRPSPLWSDTPDTLLPAAPPFVEVEATSGAVLATHTLPAVALNDSRWVNWWSPPPGRRSDIPAVVLNQYGKGRAMYCGFDLLGMVKQGFLWPQKAFGAALGMLTGEPPLLVETDLPGAVLASYSMQDEQRRLIVHLVNVTVRLLRGEVHRVDGNRLTLDAARFGARSARVVWPEAHLLAIEPSAGRLSMHLPPLAIHQVVVIDLGG